VEADAAEGVVVAEADSMNAFHDKVGLGWRSDLATGIFTHLDRIDLLEVIADDLQAPVLGSRKTLAPKRNEPDSQMRNALRWKTPILLDWRWPLAALRASVS
jgi:hypothetical protein